MQAIIISNEQFKTLLKKIERLDSLLREVQERDISNLYLSNNQLAKYLGVSKRTLQEYRNKGLISFSQVSKRKIYYKFADIEKFLQSCRVNAFNQKRIGTF